MNQEHENDKIPSPFKAPEGYFENFEDRLKQRMQAPKTETAQPQEKGRLIHMRLWIAAAATLILVAVSFTILYFQKDYSTAPIAKNPVDSTTIPAKVPQIDSAVLFAQTEEAVVEEILTEAEDPTKVTEPVSVPKDSELIAQLEEAGLIADDLDDGLFDTIEMQP